MLYFVIATEESTFRYHVYEGDNFNVAYAKWSQGEAPIHTNQTGGDECHEDEYDSGPWSTPEKAIAVADEASGLVLDGSPTSDIQEVSSNA